MFRDRQPSNNTSMERQDGTSPTSASNTPRHHYVREKSTPHTAHDYYWRNAVNIAATGCRHNDRWQGRECDSSLITRPKKTSLIIIDTFGMYNVYLTW